MRNYLYSLLRRYLSLHILAQNTVIEIDPDSNLLVAKLPQGKVAFHRYEKIPQNRFPNERVVSLAFVKEASPDYLVLSGLIHYNRDIQHLLSEVFKMCHPHTRLIITYYSSLWRPLTRLASWLGLREKTSEENWLAHKDVENLLTLENFELVKRDNKILLPIYIPIVSNLLNRYLAPLPFFRIFSLVNIVIARPYKETLTDDKPSVSIVVPARNEAGNIEQIVKRIPNMGPNDEIIFVEGHSTDGTWEVIQEVQARYRNKKSIISCQQEGYGKGDAVRRGFKLARNEILMILDADMTVPPEDLLKFYAAIKSGKGEFIIGSRLVYPMEKKAMRFFNLLANKFFATAFSYVLSQRFKDTLCGTKVISRVNYQKLAMNRSYFGEFDPFGDFDLIFGACRMGLKIVEVPINYRERIYGKTNISRWKHGGILLMMLIFAARKIKFI